MTYKTSKKDEDYFSERVFHWVRLLSLGDWKVEVYTEKLEDMSAGAQLWHDAHGVHVKLNTEFPHQPQKKWLDRLALHEVGHILLCDLKHLVNERVVTDKMIDTAEHAVIRRLESALCVA